ncbi:MAG: AAA family ATPase [Lachnospiraceae bacterium]|nr:AAA family ATPase [Lachnospiraceae bacterium]
MSIHDLIGVNGQYAIGYLNAHALDLIEQRMCKYEEDYTLFGQVNWWLHYIVGAEIKTIQIPGTDYVQASYSMNDINEIRPQNIGSGVSYLISVLVVCLASLKDSVLVIENPEIHLHPSAQSRVAEFLYFISQCDRQLF